MDGTPRLDIDELYETKQRSDIQRVTTFNRLLEKVHERIKVASRQRVNNEFCYFVMPEVLIGYPNYDFEQCLLYILSCLKRDGFLTKYIHPNLVLISWRHIVPRYVREELRTRTGRNYDQYGNDITKEEKPIIPALRFSSNTNLHSEDKTNETKTVKSNGYRPSGKFIYDAEVLKKIQDIL